MSGDDIALAQNKGGPRRPAVRAALCDDGAARRVVPSDRPRFLDASYPFAFEDVLAPLVIAASEEVALACGTERFASLDTAAIAALERSLLARLARVAAPTLISEFHLRRGIAGWLSFGCSRNSDVLHRSFVATMLDGGLDEVMGLFPDLARVVDSLIQDWIAATVEMIVRFHADEPDLRFAFWPSREVCRIAAIAPDLSDPHNGGRTVMVLTVGDGTLIVYKPRSIAMESAFSSLLRWVNAAGVIDGFRLLPMVERADYGWIAYVAAAPCRKRVEVLAFYRRAGGLLALTMLLQGTDIHHENLIASGDQPVLVDLETLLHPLPRDRPSSLPDLLDATGMVPAGKGLDFSALGAGGAVVTRYPVREVAAVASDAMEMRLGCYVAPARRNVPLLGGRRQAAATHADMVIAGFESVLRLVLRERDAFLAALDVFVGRRGRFIVRSSNAYGLCLQASLQARYMRDPDERARLLASATPGEGSSSHGIAAEREIAALQRLDVPRFEVRCDQDGVDWLSPLDEARARVAGLAESDIEEAVRALRTRLGEGPRRKRKASTASAERMPE